MKQTIYYSACVGAFIAIWFALAFLLLFLGAIGYSYGGFGYRFGSALAYPQVWLMSVGIVLLLRKQLYGFVMKEQKDFGKGTGASCIIIGAVWLLFNLLPRFMMSFM